MLALLEAVVVFCYIILVLPCRVPDFGNNLEGFVGRDVLSLNVDKAVERRHL